MKANAVQLSKIWSFLREDAESKINSEFLARGLASRDKARQTGCYVDADEVLGKLQKTLQSWKNKQDYR